jgi:CRISPR-associated protein Cas2
MQCILVYDIPDDGKRTKIADTCLDYGLDRIQYSAFVGPLLPTHQEELMLKIKQVLGKRPGNVQLFPLCEEDWHKRHVLVQQDGQTTETADVGGTDVGGTDAG